MTYIPPKKYFFAQDSDSHWYMIPAEMRETWNKYTVNDIAWDDYEKQEEFTNLFFGYMTGGGINHIEFIIPE